METETCSIIKSLKLVLLLRVEVKLNQFLEELLIQPQLVVMFVGFDLMAGGGEGGL